MQKPLPFTQDTTYQHYLHIQNNMRLFPPFGPLNRLLNVFRESQDMSKYLDVDQLGQNYRGFLPASEIIVGSTTSSVIGYVEWRPF